MNLNSRILMTKKITFLNANDKKFLKNTKIPKLSKKKLYPRLRTANQFSRHMSFLDKTYKNC